MDQVAIDAFTPEVQRALLAQFGIDPDQVTSLGGFESFVFARKDRPTIIRVTHNSHRSIDQIRAELEFINFLWRHGATVSRPIELAHDDLLASFGAFVVAEFELARGRLIEGRDWGPELFTAWGQQIGKFHRLARQFVPANAVARRRHWREDDNFDFRRRIPPVQEQILHHADAHLAAMAGLPESHEVFGLIHCDAHAGNYRYDNGALTFFDFDDSCYCFFGYDVATILFGAVLQPWIENSRAAQARAALAFLPPFLEGYARENDVSALSLERLDLFLKIRELSLYGVACAFFPEISRHNWYLIKFMHEREARLARDEPYLSLDQV